MITGLVITTSRGGPRERWQYAWGNGMIIAMPTAEKLVLEAVRELGACGPKEVYESLDKDGTHYSYGHVIEAMQRLWIAGELRRVRRGRYLVPDGIAGMVSVLSGAPRRAPTIREQQRAQRTEQATRPRRMRVRDPDLAKRAKEIVRLRVEEGLTLDEIARRFSITRERVRQIFNAETTEAQRESFREDRWCRKAAAEEAALQARKIAEDNRIARRDRWRESERQKIIRDIRAWLELFDELPSAADWDGSPAVVARMPWRKARLQSTGREWPKTRTVLYLFGTWNKAIETAGLTPRKKTDPKKHHHYYGGRGGERTYARATHCKYGHPMSGENLYVSPKGARQCKACVKRNAEAYRARKAAQAI